MISLTLTWPSHVCELTTPLPPDNWVSTPEGDDRRFHVPEEAVIEYCI
jgi:hypothetical protein